MKNKIKQRIELLNAQIKMVEMNYKSELVDCETRYNNLCCEMQDQLCILRMALNLPDDIVVKLNLN